jgi:hypothetical protein
MDSTHATTNLCMAVGIMSFNCSLRHKELPSASVRKPLSFASFRRRSLSNSRAICCRAQNVAAARWKFSPAGPSNWRKITVNGTCNCTGNLGTLQNTGTQNEAYV